MFAFRYQGVVVAALLLSQGTSEATEAGIGGVPDLKFNPGSPKAGVWTDTASTPPWLHHKCETIWTSHAVYKLPYRVDFGSRGSYEWWAPKLGVKATEVGVGKYLSPLQTITREDGSWETFYFGANRFTPDPTDSTNCCCEYVGQTGPGQQYVLADYCVAAVPGTSGSSMEEACAPHLQACPKDNATAFKELGAPFIEVYSPCVPFGEAPPKDAGFGVAVLLGVAGGLLLLGGLNLWLVRRSSSAFGKDSLGVPFLRAETEEINQRSAEKGFSRAETEEINQRRAEKGFSRAETEEINQRSAEKGLPRTETEEINQHSAEKSWDRNLSSCSTASGVFSKAASRQSSAWSTASTTSELRQPPV